MSIHDRRQGRRVVSLIFALALLPARARGEGFGEVEIGGTFGAHIFSESSELGRADNDPPANAPQHSAAVGFRVALALESHLSLELEALLLPITTRGAPATTILGLSYHAQALVHILTGRVRPFLFLGYGALTSVYSSNPVNFFLDTDEAPRGGLGVKFDITRGFGMRLDAAVMLPPRIGDGSLTTDFEVLLGVYGRINRKPLPDRDQDGVPDEKDRCPDEAGPAPRDGCPTDRDGDGTPDNRDRCPDEAGPKDNQGCLKDSDGDGLLDRDDKCPASAGPKENGGCPDTDLDGDGIVDRLDKCPKEKGKPEDGDCKPRDSDGDGILDRTDKCPNAPETRNGFQDDDGCPDEIPVEVKRFTGTIKGINFKTGSGIITRSSYSILEEAVKVLTDNPSVSIEIQGHTDDVGSRAKNLKLSQERAEAVMEFLIARHIDSNRLRAFGYGPDRPIETGKAQEARDMNRRVEFQLILTPQLVDPFSGGGVR